MIPVVLKRLPHGRDLPQPAYQTAGAAGCDLHAAIDKPLIIEPGARKLIPTGIAIELPENFEAQIRPRSGLALKYGVTVLNTPGTIDADYRGEIFVLLINLGTEQFDIMRGDRIAQLVFAPIVRAAFVESDELSQSVRGEGGFGSTNMIAKTEGAA